MQAPGSREAGLVRFPPEAGDMEALLAACVPATFGKGTEEGKRGVRIETAGSAVGLERDARGAQPSLPPLLACSVLF